MERSEIYVGQRVYHTREKDCATVVDVEKSGISIVFDHFHNDAHSLDGRCELGHGWEASVEFLEPIYDEQPDVPGEIDVMNFLNFEV